MATGGKSHRASGVEMRQIKPRTRFHSAQGGRPGRIVSSRREHRHSRSHGQAQAGPGRPPAHGDGRLCRRRRAGRARRPLRRRPGRDHVDRRQSPIGELVRQAGLPFPAGPAARGSIPERRTRLKSGPAYTENRTDPPPRLQVDEEQDVEPLQRDRLDSKEVAGDDPAGLPAQELAPADLATPRCRLDTVGAQDPPDGARRNPGCPHLEARRGCAGSPTSGPRARGATRAGAGPRESAAGPGAADTSSVARQADDASAAASPASRRTSATARAAAPGSAPSARRGPPAPAAASRPVARARAAGGAAPGSPRPSRRRSASATQVARAGAPELQIGRLWNELKARGHRGARSGAARSTACSTASSRASMCSRPRRRSV